MPPAFSSSSALRPQRVERHHHPLDNGLAKTAAEPVGPVDVGIAGGHGGAAPGEGLVVVAVAVLLGEPPAVDVVLDPPGDAD